MRHLLGISAKSQGGKDTMADHLVQHYDFIRGSFAEPLKYGTAMLCHCVLQDLHTQKGKAKINEFTGVTNRVLLQAIGTIMRKNLGPAIAEITGTEPEVTKNEGFWVNNLLYRMKTDLGPHSGVVITDLRYPNEVEMIKAAGGIVIRHNRRNWTPDPKVNSHSSETALDDYQGFHAVGSTSSVRDMVDWLNNVMAQYNIPRVV